MLIPEGVFTVFKFKKSVRFVLPMFLAAACPAATWCVNPSGANGCMATISAAVSAAAAGDTVSVSAGTYKEMVTIGVPLSLVGADAATTIIEAKGLANGIYVDGVDNQNLARVFISGFTVQDANFEGILVASASQVTISGNIVQGNDLSLNFSAGTCAGMPAFETNEGDDCGEGIHLLGVNHVTVANNTITNNSGGILITDETAASHDNLISNNSVINNVWDCGITVASHVQATISNSKTPLGVYSNSIIGNTSNGNGTKGDGAGIGIFASAPGTGAWANVVSGNTATGNGIPGISIHGHAPNQNLNDNLIIGNVLNGNLADLVPTATSASAAININAVSPITGIVVSQNTITNESLGVVVNAPGSFIIERNSFTRGSVGVVNGGSGAVSADNNYWGCVEDPRILSSFGFCATTQGAVSITTWMTAAPSK
jgi:parallel beta-helix repeat protein